MQQSEIEHCPSPPAVAPDAADRSNHRPRTARVGPATCTPLAVTFPPSPQYPQPKTPRPATTPSAHGQKPNDHSRSNRSGSPAIPAVLQTTPYQDYATMCQLNLYQLHDTRELCQVLPPACRRFATVGAPRRRVRSCASAHVNNPPTTRSSRA